MFGDDCEADYGNDPKKQWRRNHTVITVPTIELKIVWRINIKLKWSGFVNSLVKQKSFSFVIRSLENQFLYSLLVFHCCNQLLTKPVSIDWCLRTGAHFVRLPVENINNNRTNEKKLHVDCKVPCPLHALNKQRKPSVWQCEPFQKNWLGRTCFWATFGFPINVSLFVHLWKHCWGNKIYFTKSKNVKIKSIFHRHCHCRSRLKYVTYLTWERIRPYHSNNSASASCKGNQWPYTGGKQYEDSLAKWYTRLSPLRSWVRFSVGSSQWTRAWSSLEMSIIKSTVCRKLQVYSGYSSFFPQETESWQGGLGNTGPH